MPSGAVLSSDMKHVPGSLQWYQGGHSISQHPQSEKGVRRVRHNSGHIRRQLSKPEWNSDLAGRNGKITSGKEALRTRDC